MWKETGLGAKVGSRRAVETILDFLNLGEVLKIRLLQKNAKTFGKLYLEKRLVRYLLTIVAENKQSIGTDP